MTINVIALLNVVKNFVVVGFHALSHEFVEAALCPNLGRSSDKHFQFGIWKHHRANVAPIHHDTFIVSHTLLLGHKSRANKVYCRNGTHVSRYLHAPNFVLHVLAVEVSFGLSRLWIQLKLYVQRVHFRF